MDTTGWVDLHTPRGVRLDMSAAVPAVVAAQPKVDWRQARKQLGVDPYNEQALVRMVTKLGGDPLLGPDGRLRRDTREGLPYLEAQGGAVAAWAHDQLRPFVEARTLVDSLGGCVESARRNGGLVVPDVGLTVTGRCALRGAAIHGLPRTVRHMLLPDRADWSVAQIDYSAFDWRITAALSADPQLVADCAADPLTAIGEQLGCARDVAKRVSYGLAYGSGTKLMAAQLGVDIPEAERLRAGVTSRWPVWAAWRERLLELARRAEVVRTADGRVLACHRPGEPAGAGTHRAVPYAVQGTGAAVLADRLQALAGIGIGWALTWHDAVYLAGPGSWLESVIPTVVDALTLPPDWLPPISLSVKVTVADTFAAGL